MNFILLLKPYAIKCIRWTGCLFSKGECCFLNAYEKHRSTCEFFHLKFAKNPEIFFTFQNAQFSLSVYIEFYSPDIVNFDDIASSENLLHLTANRPKMPGRRLPGRFNGGHSVSYTYCCKTRNLAAPESFWR